MHWMDNEGVNGSDSVRAVPAFKDNVIWMLMHSEGALAVDPGQAEPVLAFLEQEGLPLSAILLTHHHADHCGGVCDLTARYPVPVFGPAAESITGVTYPLMGGEILALPGLSTAVEVLSVPGHTRGHVAYRYANRLFCGDTLFGAGCGRLFEGSPEQMFDSLQRLASLAPETWVHCAHEYTEANLRFALAVEPDNPALLERIVRVAERRTQGRLSIPTRLQEELETNPFLRCSVPAVQQMACHHGAILDQPDSSASVFAALRRWKDEF